MSDIELKKYTDAIMKAQDLLFDAEYELNKVMKDLMLFSDEDKGVLLDFMKCYLRTKKYNYEHMEVSLVMRLGSYNSAAEARSKFYEGEVL